MIDDEVEIAYWNMEHYNYWITLYNDKGMYYSTKNLWYDLNEIRQDWGKREMLVDEVEIVNYIQSSNIFFCLVFLQLCH